MNPKIAWINRRDRTLPAMCASLAILASLLMSVSLVSAQNPDFTINANPSSLCVNPGVDAQSLVSISSVGGFTGTVNLGQSLSPTYPNGPTVSSIPPSVTLSSDQTIDINVTMSTTTSTPLSTYTITVFGFSGGAYHQANIELSVNSGCSVGGVIVPTALTSTGSVPLVASVVGIASVIAVVAAVIVYVNRKKSSIAP
jgi:hypothetical protein